MQNNKLRVVSSPVLGANCVPCGVTSERILLARTFALRVELGPLLGTRIAVHNRSIMIKPTIQREGHFARNELKNYTPVHTGGKYILVGKAFLQVCPTELRPHTRQSNDVPRLLQSGPPAPANPQERAPR
eukprot:SAG11_NODE_3597_length_2347_cov_3.269573_2_plen_130_part_00